MTTDTELYARMGKVEGEVESIKKTQGAHGEKLDNILSALSGHQPFIFRDVLATIKDVFVICGLIVAGIVYVAGNFTSAERAVSAYRIKQLEDKLTSSTYRKDPT